MWLVWLVVASAWWRHIKGGISEDMVVDTENGRIRGLIYYATHINRQIYSFLGIPFAKPPIRHLRFKHPQTYGKWDGVYNASKLPNSCIQVPDLTFGKDFAGSNIWNPTTKVSEDCLYLNIWVPNANPRLRKAAVMVWIHGGGFYAGTPTLNVYDGKALAGNNSVIVVSIAYRLGVFGFLSLNHPSAPGNAGLFDQVVLEGCTSRFFIIFIALIYFFYTYLFFLYLFIYFLCNLLHNLCQSPSTKFSTTTSKPP